MDAQALTSLIDKMSQGLETIEDLQKRNEALVKRLRRYEPSNARELMPSSASMQLHAVPGRPRWAINFKDGTTKYFHSSLLEALNRDDTLVQYGDDQDEDENK